MNSSWCHKIFFTSLTIITTVLILEYKYAILPIHGIYLIIYLFVSTICTGWITFILLQKLLQSNKPIKHEENLFLQWISRYYNSTKGPPVSTTKSDKPAKLEDRIETFVGDIEKRFILKWYSTISDDPTFPTEAKVLLDNIICRFLQVVVEVDNEKFAYGAVIVFLKHIKEFRRAFKRSSKSNIVIEDLYRYSHVASKSDKSLQQFIQQLTANVLRQFINWELWNSLPCRTLVSIISRKLTRYIITLLSSPGFLNYQIVKMCAADVTKRNMKLEKYAFISISDEHNKSLQQLREKLSTVKSLKLEESNTPKLSPRKVICEVKQTSDVVDAPKRIKSSDGRTQAELSTAESFKVERRIKKATEPVKIHESRSANRTWRNSSDLECISLGQDLLAFPDFGDPNSQIQELIDKKLWKDNLGDDDKASGMWDIPESWYGEEETMEVLEPVQLSPTSQIHNYLKNSTATSAILTNTMKPLGNVTANTLHNMKELQQSTVNTVTNVVKPVSQATTNAMHKIGDLQDEAAGVVEGILDFGMAGLRKGLRLTGLQENLSELTQKAKNEFQTHKLEAQKTIDIQKPYCIGKITEAIKIIDKESHKHGDTYNKNMTRLVKIPHILSEDRVEGMHQSSSDSDESVWVNPLNTGSSPSFEGDILLEKTPDSLPKHSVLGITNAPEVPEIKEEVIETSPDLEYEEAQDFASTIAKLRCLLQQKSSESSFTTPALSPMPQDEISKTPADPPPNDITKADGAMPSLYKFCARTATGVFQNTLNTIKTALPGNVNEPTVTTRCSSEDWTFVETDSLNDDFSSRMKRLLSERRAYCTVDTAYEAIDSLDVTDKTDFSWSLPTCQFDDDMDEFEQQVPITKALVDIVCELIGDSNTYMLRESVVKAVLLLISNSTEQFIQEKSKSLLYLPSTYIGQMAGPTDQNVLALKLDEVVKICKEIFPDLVKVILGDNTIEIGICLFIKSVQNQKINQDVFMQLLELFASSLINACGKTSPTFSA